MTASTIILRLRQPPTSRRPTGRARYRGEQLPRISALVPGCSGRYRVLPPLPETSDGHAFPRVPEIPDIELAQFLAPRAWNSNVDRVAWPRLLFSVSACGAASSARAW